MKLVTITEVDTEIGRTLKDLEGKRFSANSSTYKTASEYLTALAAIRATFVEQEKTQNSLKL